MLGRAAPMAKRRRKGKGETRNIPRLSVVDEMGETIRVPSLVAPANTPRSRLLQGESTVDMRKRRPVEAEVGEETVRIPGMAQAPVAMPVVMDVSDEDE